MRRERTRDASSAYLGSLVQGAWCTEGSSLGWAEEWMTPSAEKNRTNIKRCSPMSSVSHVSVSALGIGSPVASRGEHTTLDIYVHPILANATDSLS